MNIWRILLGTLCVIMMAQAILTLMSLALHRKLTAAQAKLIVSYEGLTAELKRQVGLLEALAATRAEHIEILKEQADEYRRQQHTAGFRATS